MSNWKSFVQSGLTVAIKKIDAVLDIQEEETEESAAELLTPVPSAPPENISISDAGGLAALETHNSWAEKETAEVVLAEPNPIRDDHGPRPSLSFMECDGSVSPDEANTDRNSDEYQHSPSRSEEGVFESSDEPAQLDKHEHIEGEREWSAVSHSLLDRRGSHDEVATVASSDIEVVKNLEAWSVCSSNNVHNMDASVLMRDAVLSSNQKRLDEIKNELEKTKEECRQLRHLHQNSNTENARLQKAVLACEGDKEQLKTEGSKLMAENQKLRNEIRKLKERSNAAEKKSGTLSSELRKAEVRAETVEEEKAVIQEELLKSQEEALAFKKELESLQQQISTMSVSLSENTSAAQGVEELNAVKAQLEEQITETTNELEFTQEQLRDREIEYGRLKSQFAATEAELRDLKSLVPRLEAELAVLQSHSTPSDELMARMDVLEQQLTDSRQLNSRLQTELHEADKVARETSDDRERCDKVISHLRADRDRLRQSEEELLKKVNQLHEELMRLADKECEKCSRVNPAKLQERIEHLQQREHLLSLNCSEQEITIGQFRARIDELEEQVQWQRELADKKEEELRDLCDKLQQAEEALPGSSSPDPATPGVNKSYKMSTSSLNEELLRQNGELLEQVEELRLDKHDLRQVLKELSAELAALQTKVQMPYHA